VYLFREGDESLRANTVKVFFVCPKPLSASDPSPESSRKRQMQPPSTALSESYLACSAAGASKETQRSSKVVLRPTRLLRVQEINRTASERLLLRLYLL
jgi:hypothetical protein